MTMENISSSLRPKHNGTKKVFDNPFLERLSRTHIAVPISIFVLISAALLWYAYLFTILKLSLVLVLFLSGVVFWTLLEYIAHRFLFHMKPDTETKKKWQYNMHGIHHEFPKDKERLAMPPLLSVFIASIFFAIFYLLMNTKVFGFLPGMLCGYAGYLFVHYIVHAYQPPKNFFKELWINHSIHHYKDSTVVFGVSSPLWDFVFGTLPKKGKA
jgi:sterol desaturase/sphingolipid hydroxylase (fatty acid hydroxylase superfamily)